MFYRYLKEHTKEIFNFNKKEMLLLTRKRKNCTTSKHLVIYTKWISVMNLQVMKIIL